jgi:hypothetical protein
MLLAAAGCTQILGVQDITLGDAGMGSGADTAFTACISDPTITLFKPCFATLPTMDVQLQGTIDTDMCAMGTKQSQGSGKPMLCVIAGKTVTVPTPGVRANGSLPLVIAAVTDITVSAMIDVSGGKSLPAAGAQSCSPPTAGSDGAGAGGGGGGAGGAFGGASAGGGSAGGMGGSGTGGIGKLMSVRGGCNGSAGGNGNTGSAGAAGSGGGAIYLVAGNSVTINASATLSAAGGGGGGGGIGGGGGGGGASGGLIAIEAPTLGVNGVLYANGGGGGGGGASTAAGSPGNTGTLSTAAGGAGASGIGGNGGNGGVDAAASVVGGGPAGSGGGGGGGGSTGIIWFNYMFADTSGSSISPAETGP